jgi:hypothetical protein
MSLLEQALKRPLGYNKMFERRQWETDAQLGILDWEPSKEESDEYIRRRIEMGDPDFVPKDGTKS